ncbi:hypothetical protein [Lysinibacillus xylanilyticus]|uniref:hypothetical protein n=1 Tax=Lysinibacillus xylanilyticus TaxID=582475 RepID=UPI003D98B701
MRRLQTELVQKGLSKEVKGQAAKSRQPKRKMNQREIEELMGVRGDTYRRKNGAIRRK